MQYIDILDVNIYHLQLFIYTVECGSMTKAANLAHVSQSMLSKTISKLEQKFGLQLFVRKNNGLSVTPAGKILYDESVKLKGSLELALEKAHLAQEARRLPIRVAYLNTVDPGEYMNRTLENFASCYPDCQFRIEKGSFTEIREMMFHDEVDVLFTSFFEEEDFDRGIYYTKRMICCSQMAYMLNANPLSKREKLYFSDLRNQNFISLSPSKSPNYMKNAITRYSAEAGFIPKIAYFVQSSESISENEFGEYDIFIADQYFNVLDTERFIAKKIENTEGGVSLVCRRTGSSHIQEFVREAAAYWHKSYDDLE